jgi:hypothetical protein
MTTSATLLRYLDLKLAANGYAHSGADDSLLAVAGDLIEAYREKTRLLTGHLCPPDRRIQNFLNRHLADVLAETGPVALPSTSFMLDRDGLARLLSLPPDRDEFHAPLLSSYRVAQGVLHNPKSDRRTTAGLFHIAEGGLTIPGDKKAVPKAVFARLLQQAMQPPEADLVLPYTAHHAEPARDFVSLLLRPLVRPAVGSTPGQSMEIRAFAPGSLVSNLDFLESIFGNAGNPYLPDNDAALDADHWTGHTGCLILAPHLTSCSKKSLGLPHISKATARQQADGMCWIDGSERYNDGQAFKCACRTAEGVMVTIIADNYYGYCKKEVKTQISYSANLLGQAEEEHAGGAIAFPSYSLGEDFRADSRTVVNDATWDDVAREQGHLMDLQPEGYGIDKRHPTIIYVPESACLDIRTQRVTWKRDGQTVSILLRPRHCYVLPSGYKIRMEKHSSGASWRLIGTEPEGTFCHKPCTVSGGGKSEISKSIADFVLYGPLHVNDLDKDLDCVEELLQRDYSDRLRPEHRPAYSSRVSGRSRSILSPERSLGSVIKMFTPSPEEFTDEYNAWLKTIPTRILTLLFLVKRFHRTGRGDDWRSHFSVDIVNGAPGHHLKIDNRPLVASYLRVGIDDDGTWRTYKLRQDFIAADKVQLEDDISVSTIVPSAELPHLSKRLATGSVKLVANCERRLFQRPDEAIHRGQDKQAEADLAAVNGEVFISNFQPLNAAQARELVDDAIGLDRWSAPMRRVINAVAERGSGHVVSSAHPRLVDGKPSKNPRYLQERPDLVDTRGTWLAEVGQRLYRRVPAGVPLPVAVDAVLPGRRNNPPENGVRALACHNPIHYLEIPELFMEFASSLTGKSPSTTGAGSEGALTKGPFNALDPIIDLDNALLSMALTGHDGFTTSAGSIGPHIKVGHDISLLIPEIWCRLSPKERSAAFLIRDGHLERLTDFEHKGRRVLASRLGYRITARFVHTFLGKIFDNPAAVFDVAMLKPETQNLEAYIDGIDNIVEAQARCARQYLDDGAAKTASPPLLAILDVMATGKHKGLEPESPAFRALFTRQAMLSGPWYLRRLETQQAIDTAKCRRQVSDLKNFLALPSHRDVSARLDLAGRLARAEARLESVQRPGHIDRLRGTLGAHPSLAIMDR